jgi:prepilin signal peptidase PulO-like enzyme (type II secretory pathway)
LNSRPGWWVVASEVGFAALMPVLYWTAAAVVVTLAGYPGVVCMTPVAWLLALPVGTGVERSSTLSERGMLLEAAAAGGLLGTWQGLLFGAVMVVGKYVDPALSDPGSPFLAALLMVCLGAPVTMGLSVMMAWLVRRRALARGNAMEER